MIRLVLGIVLLNLGLFFIGIFGHFDGLNYDGELGFPFLDFVIIVGLLLCVSGVVHFAKEKGTGFIAFMAIVAVTLWAQLIPWFFNISLLIIDIFPGTDSLLAFIIIPIAWIIIAIGSTAYLIKHLFFTD